MNKSKAILAARAAVSKPTKHKSGKYRVKYKTIGGSSRFSTLETYHECQLTHKLLLIETAMHKMGADPNKIKQTLLDAHADGQWHSFLPDTNQI